MKKKLFITMVLAMLVSANTFAQCALCRATVTSNLSEGRGVIGTGINAGILFLLVVTYLTIPTLIWVWYRTAKKEMKLKKI